MIARISDTISLRCISVSPPKSAITGALVKIVWKERSTARFEPAICKLMENSAVMVMMPASRSRTCSRTWISPVAAPASAPAAMAASSVSQGSTPRTSNTALTAAPSGKLPSTVRSGKSRMR